MVIVIPIEAINQLIQVAQAYQLSLPIPLSSDCAGYLSLTELDIILETLAPFSNGSDLVARLFTDLQRYQAQGDPVVPCESL